MFVVTETKSGTRIHRDTCKRQGESLPIDEQLAAVDIASGTAKAAGCCKPLPSLQEDSMLAPEPAPVEIVDTSVLIRFTGPKHYWRALRGAGATVAKRQKGVKVESRNNGMALVLSGSQGAVETAEEHVIAAWGKALSQFKEAGGLKGLFGNLPHAEAYAKSQEWLQRAAVAK